MFTKQKMIIKILILELYKRDEKRERDVGSYYI